MPECLTKKIEIEGDGSKIQEHEGHSREFKCREFKITKGILDKFGYSENCKGCEAAAAGTDPRRHSDDCRSRMETLIREDEVLKVRLDMRDIRLDRGVDGQRDGDKEDVNVEAVMEDEEVAGHAVAEELMKTRRT